MYYFFFLSAVGTNFVFVGNVEYFRDFIFHNGTTLENDIL